MTRMRSPVHGSARSRALKIRERRKQVVELIRQGYPAYEIAEMLGVRHQMVCKDLKIMEAIWLRSGMLDLQKVKLKELYKLDQMERICIEKLSKINDPRSGTRWIEERRKIIERRCKMLGLDAPKQVAMAAHVVHETKEQRDAAVRAAAIANKNDLPMIEAEIIDTPAIEHQPHQKDSTEHAEAESRVNA